MFVNDKTQQNNKNNFMFIIKFIKKNENNILPKLVAPSPWNLEKSTFKVSRKMGI